MNRLSGLLDPLQTSVQRDLLAFAPELILIGTILLLLIARMLDRLQRLHFGWLALAGTLVALGGTIEQWLDFVAPTANRDGPFPVHTLWMGMLVQDGVAIFVRGFLLAFTALTLLLGLLTGIPDAEDSADFSTLLLGATLGMMLMASAQHLLMLVIAVEMASLPSYALAGFLKGRRTASEAALKYVVFGAASAGVMLYGVSLLTLKFGTGYLPDVAIGYRAVLQQGGFDLALAAGTVMILVGLAFKLSAVPFHFWCPDVFEGAAAEVAAFLSVASKGAALALTARWVVTLGSAVSDELWPSLARPLGIGLAILAAVTMTFGNLAALGQTNLKRLLAYSTIAHAGTMLMGIVPLYGPATASVWVYLSAYLLLNLGAFAVVALRRNETGRETDATLRGLVQTHPLLAIALAIFLVGLLGLPPTVGFPAKFQVFSATAQAAQVCRANGEIAAAGVYYGLLVCAALNTLIAAAVYLRLLRLMFLEPPQTEALARPLRPIPLAATGLIGVLAGCVLLTGIFWNPLMQSATQAVEGFPLRSVALGALEARP